MSIFYALVFMLVGMSHIDAAPTLTRWESVTNNPYQQSEVERILKDAIFNTTENFYVIKKAFQAQPGSHKICIPIAYNITCADQPECEDSLTDHLRPKCTSGYYVPVLWVEFDASDTASKLLLFFATSGFTVFGFDWADACDIPYSYESFNLSTVSLPVLDLVISCNDTMLESELNQTLLYLTTLMPNYAALSKFPSIFDDKIMGYAVEAELYFDDHQPVFIAYTIIFAIVSFFIILGLSTPLFVTIGESIQTTKKGKPKLYYHFWSSVVLIIVGIWGYEILYHVVKIHHGSQPYSHPYFVLLLLMIIESFIGAMIAMISAARGTYDHYNLFSVPLSDICCNDGCRLGWTWLITPIGLFFFLSLIVYILYTIPTIILVYYLYPTRTLIRTPFIIGAIFYTLAFLSLVLHQFEKVCTATLLCICVCNRPLFGIDFRHITNNSESDDDLDDPKVFETGQIRLQYPPRLHDSRYHRCWHGFNIDLVAQQNEHNQDYYKMKLYEDLKIVQGICHPIMVITQLLAVTAILIAIIYGEILLAKLVFKQTNDTNINSLLAILPTIIFSIFAWFGRNLIFDVREDLKELSIPYLKKRETVEEKILRAIINLKRELQHGIKIKKELQANNTGSEVTENVSEEDGLTSLS